MPYWREAEVESVSETVRHQMDQTRAELEKVKAEVQRASQEASSQIKWPSPFMSGLMGKHSILNPPKQNIDGYSRATVTETRYEDLSFGEKVHELTRVKPKKDTSRLECLDPGGEPLYPVDM
jgi:uncharacterized protein YdhG (YjbR/CyaY superfamily)